MADRKDHGLKELPALRRLMKAFHPQGIPWPFSSIYSRLSRSSVFQSHYDRVADDMLRYGSKGKVLDIGTGPGWLPIMLARKAAGLQLTGLDISSSMVEKARENAARSGVSGMLEFKEGSSEHIPYPDSCFDLVVSTGSLHHWKEPVKGINEAFRVLKKGGYALIYDIASDTPKEIIKSASREFGRMRLMLMWVHSFEEPFYSVEGFNKLAGAALFREAEVRFVGVLCCLAMQKRS